MERQGLEKLVDDLFERSDKRVHEIMHRIARLACEKEIEGLSQIPPVSVSNMDDEYVVPSSWCEKLP